MKTSMKSYLVEELGGLASVVIRAAMSRPRRMPNPTTEAPVASTSSPKPAKAYAKVAKTVEPPKTISDKERGVELDYRYECVLKHLGEAGGVLREAYERVLDEGVGDGTSEKVMECLNAHATAEPDLEKMMDIPEGKELADNLMSGIRQFRAGAWATNMPRGGGTQADIEAARRWNGVLYQEAYSAAKKYPGEICIAEGL